MADLLELLPDLRHSSSRRAGPGNLRGRKKVADGLGQPYTQLHEPYQLGPMRFTQLDLDTIRSNLPKILRAHHHKREPEAD